MRVTERPADESTIIHLYVEDRYHYCDPQDAEVYVLDDVRGELRPARKSPWNPCIIGYEVKD